MEPPVTTPAAPDSTHPVTAHTTLRPLPRHSVLIALIVAAILPALLLILTIVVMASAKYNFLNWME